MRRQSIFTLVALLGGLFVSMAPLLAEDNSPAVSGDSALAIFRQRIVPILKAPNASSCRECHLSGVDLKDYICEDHAKTFAALRAAGLVDTNRPDNSKILKFIQRQPEKPSLVTEKIRQLEYEAFRAWIQAAVKDPQAAAARVNDDAIGPQLPLEVIRHMRSDRVLDSFVQNIWSEVGRCAACHSPDRNQQQVKKFGDQVSWIKLGDPRATLQYIVDADLLDLDKPEKSLLLLKPTKQVDHGGGVKMTIGDRTYTQFHRFITDYAASKKGKYKAASEMPRPSDESSAVSDIWMKFTNVPAKFDTKVLRVDLFRFDDATGTWSAERWGTGDRQVAGKLQLWQQHLTVTAPKDTSRAKNLLRSPTLPAGRYLAKVYVDEDGRLEKEYPYELGDREFVGKVEFTSQWPAGYGKMTAVAFPMQ